LPLAAAFALLSVPPAVSFAQTTTAASTPGPSENATPEDQAEAQRLYQAGLESFRAREYEAALSRFSEAYRLSQAPLLLYNMAQAQRLRGECSAALSLYREFSATSPSGKARELAELHQWELSHCEVLHSTPSAQAALPAPSERPAAKPASSKAAHSRQIFTQPPAERQPAKKRDRTAALVSFGSALALFGVSGYFAWRADRAADEVSNVFATRGTWSQALAERERQGIRDAQLGVASLIGGLVATGTGTVLWTFD